MFHPSCAIAIALLSASSALAQPAISFTSPLDPNRVKPTGVEMLELTPPRELATKAEIVLVSGYESTGSRHGPVAKIHLDRPGKTVLLILSSYHKIEWEVSAGPTTRLAGIVVSGYEAPVVSTTLPAKVYRAKLPTAYKLDSPAFTETLGVLNRWFGVRKVDTFRGNYKLPSALTIASTDGPHADLTIAGPAAVKPVRNLVFSAITTDYRRTPLPLTGPPQGRNNGFESEGKLALTGSGKPVYKLNHHKLEVVDRAGGTATVLPLPARFPEMSWPTDVAFDAKRNLITVASLGGEGFFYRYDVSRKAWLDFRSLNNVDISSLSYDTRTDRYVAWTSDGRLMLYSPEGSPLLERRLLPRMTGLTRRYDSGNGQPPRLALSAQGDDVALMFMAEYAVKNIWHYDIKTDTVTLTFQQP